MTCIHVLGPRHLTDTVTWIGWVYIVILVTTDLYYWLLDNPIFLSNAGSQQPLAFETPSIDCQGSQCGLVSPTVSGLESTSWTLLLYIAVTGSLNRKYFERLSVLVIITLDCSAPSSPPQSAPWFVDCGRRCLQGVASWTCQDALLALPKPL